MLFVGAYFLWTQDSRRGGEYPVYSIRRTDATGAAVAYRLYQQAGLAPQVWDEDLTRLKSPGLLLLIAPTPRKEGVGGMLGGKEGDLLPFEIEAVDRWVQQGNVVVVMSRDPNDLYQALGLTVEKDRGNSALTATPAQPSILARGVQRLHTQTQFGFKFGRSENTPDQDTDAKDPEPPIPAIPQAEWLELFSKKSSEQTVSQVVSAARGKGLYVAVNDVFPASNVGIATADNADFVLNLAGLVPPGGTIWFDEYHKRAAERGFMSYLRERALMPVLIYALLVVALLFWRSGSRFGEAEPLVLDRRRDSGEYVKAVATLYQSAGMPRDALATIYADFRRRLVGALRMDGLTDLDEVGRRYETRTGRPAIEARGALIETEAALAREKLDEAEALQYCARLTQIDEALHQRALARRGTDKR